MYRGSVFFSQIIPEENAASTCMLPKNEKEKKRAALGMIKQGQYDRLKLHRIRSRVIIVPLGGEGSERVFVAALLVHRPLLCCSLLVII